jgi:protein O-GlcNAc transferase
VGRALQYFRAALRVNPAHTLARTNFLFVKNYDPEMNNQAALQLHCNTAAELRQLLGTPQNTWKNEPDPERNLRIGYLSSDFRRHSVAHFITPVLEAHDREGLQVNAYYTGNRQDEWSERIAGAVHQFTAAGSMSDEDLHKKIVQDGVDILVDLNGYTRGHRIETLMRRAAPVQVSWIGYPNTLGLDVMDYRIVDGITDPEPGSARHNSETLIYMDPVFSVYLPDFVLPDVALEAPASKAGYFTFGSFNSLPKLNPDLLKMWGQILTRVEGSKLLVKNRMLEQPSVRREVSLALTNVGIAEDRQILLGRTTSPLGHMQSYRQVDLCLDSFPYNGTTTTCDSLVMGVPVVTLSGSRHVSRVTASQLQALDLGSLIANDVEQYVSIATELASNPGKLNDMRRELRERMQKSALMDYQGFTRQLEQKYRDIWRHWCAEAVNMNPA